MPGDEGGGPGRRESIRGGREEGYWEGRIGRGEENYHGREDCLGTKK